MIYHSWINNLSGWDRTWKISGLTGNRTLTCEMTGHNALSNQTIWRAGHWEIVTYPLVEMTWMEIYEMTRIYFELRNYQKKIFGCLRYEELSTKYFYSFNPHLPTYQKSHPQFEIYPFRLVWPKDIDETVLMERRCRKHYFQLSIVSPLPSFMPKCKYIHTL